MTDDTGIPIVVVGAGVVGWMVAWQLGLLGARVRIVDRLSDRATGASNSEPAAQSGPETRLVRHDQRDPISARLAMLSEQWWRTLARRSSRSFVSTTGCIDIGQPDSSVAQGIIDRLQSLELDHEVLEAGELTQRYPLLEAPRDTVAIVQRGTISIHAANAITALRSEGRALGIDSSSGTELARWRPDSCVLIREDGEDETCRFDRLVICTGVGLQRDAPSLTDLEVRRYECVHAMVPPGRLAVDTPPVALHADAPGRSMRVVPSRSGAALTICEARRGRAAEESAVELPVGATELMPGLSPLAVSGYSCSEVCASTDASFSLEWLDDDSRVLAVGGFGTNGYALSPTVARAVAELLVDGRTEIELPAGLPVRRG